MAKQYYVNGNTVREVEVEVPERAREEQIRIQRETKRRQAARKNRLNATRVSLGYMAFLGVSFVSIASAAYIMIQTQFSISNHMATVAELESQVATLKADNDARYKELTTSVDLDYIKGVAINRLGMTYASEDQIEYYTVEEKNYMDQYGDIPQ